MDAWTLTQVDSRLVAFDYVYVNDFDVLCGYPKRKSYRGVLTTGVDVSPNQGAGQWRI